MCCPIPSLLANYALTLAQGDRPARIFIRLPALSYLDNTACINRCASHIGRSTLDTDHIDGRYTDRYRHPYRAQFDRA